MLSILNKKKYLKQFLSIIAVVLSIYGPSLNDIFLSDDFDFLNRVSSIYNFNSWILTIFSNIGGDFFYRPIINFSFWFDFLIWGYNPFGFHLTNILFFVGTSLLLYFFCVAIFDKNKIAFWVTILFVATPFRHETVSWISGRTDLLMFFFSIGSLLFWALYRKHNKISYLFISYFGYLVALYSKEVAVLLLPSIIILDFGFFRYQNELRKKLAIYFPYFLLMGLYFLNRYLIVGSFISETGIEGQALYFGPNQGIFTLQYITIILFHPFYFVINSSLASLYPVAQFFSDNWNVFFIVFVFSFCLFTLISYKHFLKKNFSVRAISLLAVYIINLAFIFGYVNFIGDDLSNSRFLYLASTWAIIGFVWLLLENRSMPRLVTVGLTVIFIIFFTASLFNYQAWERASTQTQNIASKFFKFVETTDQKIFYTLGFPCQITGAQALCYKNSFKYLVEQYYKRNDLKIRPVYGPVRQPDLKLCEDKQPVILKWSEGSQSFIELSPQKDSMERLQNTINLLESNVLIKADNNYQIGDYERFYFQNDINIMAQQISEIRISLLIEKVGKKQNLKSSKLLYKTTLYEKMDHFINLPVPEEQNGIVVYKIVPCEYPQFFSSGTIQNLELELPFGASISDIVEYQIL